MYHGQFIGRRCQQVDYDRILLSRDDRSSTRNCPLVLRTQKGSIVDTENPITEEGIEDKNFVGTAEKLYKERLDALDNEF